MKLIDEFASFGDLDKARRQCLTFGRTRQNRVVPLGDPPKITLGEKLRSTYTKFYQVDTKWTRETAQFDAISAVGELKFHVNLEFTFRISRKRAEDAILDGYDVQESLVRPFEKLVRKIAKDFQPNAYKAFEDAVDSQLLIDAAALSRDGNLEVNAVDIAVRRDKNVSDQDEVGLLYHSLQERLFKATHDDDMATADRLRKTLNLVRDLQGEKHVETIDVAARSKEIQASIRDLMDGDMASDDPVIVSLKRQQANLVRQAESSYSGNGAIGMTEEPKPSHDKESELPKDMD